MNSLSIFTFLSVIIWPLQCTVIPEPRYEGALLISSHIPLVQRQSYPPARLGRRCNTASETITSEAEFWFSEFTVGGSSNLTMLIDTGSNDVVLNPGIYAPGKDSQPLNITFESTYGTTESNGTGSSTVGGTLYLDEISFGSLTTRQVIGSAAGPDNAPIPGHGIVGFSGQNFGQFPTNSTSFFQTLCNQKKVSQCRFGLALGADGTGTQILGEIDTALFSGELSTAPILEPWVLAGDLVIDGEISAADLVIEMDSGTTTIVGPVEAVARVFNATGIQPAIQSTPEGEVLKGYFPCDKPPTVGFSFPSSSNASAAASDISSPVSHTSSIFNIPSGAWAADNLGNNNCTAILSGQDYPKYPGLWVVGQSFFQGLYIDHNLENGTMGFATMAHPVSSTVNHMPTIVSNIAGSLRGAVKGPILAVLVSMFLIVM